MKLLTQLLMTQMLLIAASHAGLVSDSYFKASNTETEDSFGNSVSIDGDTMVIGAPLEDGNGSSQANNSADRSGAAYVFVRSGGTWTQQAYLKEPAPSQDAYFGSSVAISGDTIVVGGPNKNTGRGAVCVFLRSAGVWSYHQTLTAANADNGDRFGVAVDIDGDTIVVGAEGEDSNLTNGTNNSMNGAGAAYVYTPSAGLWGLQAFLKASNAASASEFGNSVAISGDTVVIGAVGEAGDATGVNGTSTSNLLPSAGAAYVFTRLANTWTQQAYLKASNTGEGDFFGRSVAIDVNTIVVGATSEDSNAKGVNGNQTDNSSTFAGAAYVFFGAGANWNQQAYLKATNSGPLEFFGHSVAVEGSTVIVSAVQENSGATGVNGNQNDTSMTFAGAAYVFQRIDPVWKTGAYL